MSARKRWSVTLWPSVTTRQHPSERSAYKSVKVAKDCREAGLTRTSTIVVKVSEAGSTKWDTYERFQWANGEWSS